jgi:hypothetical protein
MAESRFPQLRIMVVAGLAVVTMLGGLFWWWSRPSLHLPQSACWSVLTKADLKPLAGSSGDFKEKELGNNPFDGLTSGGSSCSVADGHRNLLFVQMSTLDDGLFRTGYEGDLRAWESRIDFGPSLKGFATDNTSVYLAFHCDNPVFALDQRPNISIRVQDMHDVTALPDRQILQLHADFAVKFAKEAVRRHLCSNDVQFPAGDPVVAAS